MLSQRAKSETLNQRAWCRGLAEVVVDVGRKLPGMSRAESRRALIFQTVATPFMSVAVVLKQSPDQ
eukprot:11157300-Lingulodinium_polyedra.AAC.1